MNEMRCYTYLKMKICLVVLNFDGNINTIAHEENETTFTCASYSIIFKIICICYSVKL